MEFKFSVNDLFKNSITKVPDTLLPTGFVAQDRRTLVECQAKVAEVLNCMGQASAVAQGLSKPITSAERLRTSDHTVYVLVDPEDGRHGSVTGLLKVGRKRLYVFDPSGRHHQLRPLCVLDFYVHESRQRSGLGRRLFDYMLQDEDVEPVRLAIDRPSDKFLGFLAKHYNLRHVIPQMNNFVVFEGFFVPSDEIDPGRVSPSNFVNKMSPNNKSYLTHEDDSNEIWISGVKKPPYNGLQLTPTYGRYGAPRPNCTMGQMLASNVGYIKPKSNYSEETTPVKYSVNSSPRRQRPNTLSLRLNEVQVEPPKIHIDDAPMQNNHIEEPITKMYIDTQNKTPPIIENINNDHSMTNGNHNKIQLNGNVEQRIKQNHLIQVNQSVYQRSKSPVRTPDQLTRKGYFDLKFYHSKLW